MSVDLQWREAHCELACRNYVYASVRTFETNFSKSSWVHILELVTDISEKHSANLNSKDKSDEGSRKQLNSTSWKEFIAWH
jgi:hypothetical protein